MISGIKKALWVGILSIGIAGSAAAQEQGQEPIKILTIGDSLMAAHRISNRSISSSIRKSLSAEVTDRSIVGARIIYKLPLSGALGLNIGKQFRRGKWDWVVVSGGGNDLWLGCGCLRCDRKMNKLITPGGDKGAIPKLVNKIRKTGARVVYLGYLRSPGMGSPIEHCKDEGDELETRIEKMAAADDGVVFVSLRDLVPYGDRTYHGMDMIHPSLKASREIGQRIARAIAAQ
jgi:hypothetical protein